MKKILLFCIVLISCLSLVSSINASSNSYSFNLFGNDLSSGSFYYNSYSASFISQIRGTTRNAESNNFRGNIGFFEESVYSKIVNIISYSISPKSAVVGSTISLSISALNAQSVWAKIISPNSHEEILNLINGGVVSYLPSPSVVGNYQVIFYANSSNGAISSVIDSFELTSQQSNGGGSSGGGGGGGIIEKCTYNWDCTPWSVCSDNKQNRSCSNIGSCKGVEGKPLEVISCSEFLFDVLLRIEEIYIDENNNLKFNVALNETIGLDRVDVHVKYSIIDSKNYEIFSQLETRAVQKYVSYDKVIEDFNLEDGKYVLRVDVLYGNLQRAFAEHGFEILDKKIILKKDNSKITGLASDTNILYQKLSIPVVLSFVVVISLIAFYYVKRRKFKVLKNKDVLGGIIGLSVYTDNGLKIGSVYEVVISNNKVYGLAVNVDKNVPINYGKIIIRYEYIRNIKDVVVVSSQTLGLNN